MALTREGYTAKRLSRNPDHKKPLEQHRYRRCPSCFNLDGPRVQLPRDPPAWITSQPGRDGTHYVYLLRDRENCSVYVGYTAIPRDRFLAHWRRAASLDGSIGWLHHRLLVNPTWAPDVELIPFPDQGSARAHEKHLQRTGEKWAPGWNLSGTM